MTPGDNFHKERRQKRKSRQQRNQQISRQTNFSNTNKCLEKSSSKEIKVCSSSSKVAASLSPRLSILTDTTRTKPIGIFNFAKFSKTITRDGDGVANSVTKPTANILDELDAIILPSNSTDIYHSKQIGKEIGKSSKNDKNNGNSAKIHYTSNCTNLEDDLAKDIGIPVHNSTEITNKSVNEQLLFNIDYKNILISKLHENGQLEKIKQDIEKELKSRDDKLKKEMIQDSSKYNQYNGVGLSSQIISVSSNPLQYTPNNLKNSGTHAPSRCMLTPTSLLRCDNLYGRIDSHSRTSSWLADQRSACHVNEDHRRRARSPSRHRTEHRQVGGTKGTHESSKSSRDAGCNAGINLAPPAPGPSNRVHSREDEESTFARELLRNPSAGGLLCYDREAARKLSERRRKQHLCRRAISLSSEDENDHFSNLNPLSIPATMKGGPNISATTCPLRTQPFKSEYEGDSDISDNVYSPDVAYHRRPFHDCKRDRISERIPVDTRRRRLHPKRQLVDIQSSPRNERIYTPLHRQRDYKTSNPLYNNPNYTTPYDHNDPRITPSEFCRDQTFNIDESDTTSIPWSRCAKLEPLESSDLRGVSPRLTDYTFPKGTRRFPNQMLLTSEEEDNGCDVETSCFEFRNAALNRNSSFRVSPGILCSRDIDRRHLGAIDLQDSTSTTQTRTHPGQLIQDIYSTTDDLMGSIYPLESSSTVPSHQRRVVNDDFIIPTLPSLDQRPGLVNLRDANMSFSDPTMRRFNRSHSSDESESPDCSELPCFKPFNPRKEKSLRNNVGSFFKK